MNRLSLSIPRQGTADRSHGPSGMLSEAWGSAAPGALPGSSGVTPGPEHARRIAAGRDALGHGDRFAERHDRYRVNQAADADQPLQFGVYRSSDSQFDSGDTLVGSWQAGPTTQGQAGSPIDDAGSAGRCPGIHRSRSPCPAACRPIPRSLTCWSSPIPDLLGDRATPTQTASFRTHVIGIVTHGGLQNTRLEVSGRPGKHRRRRS